MQASLGICCSITRRKQIFHSVAHEFDKDHYVLVTYFISKIIYLEDQLFFTKGESFSERQYVV